MSVDLLRPDRSNGLFETGPVAKAMLKLHDLLFEIQLSSSGPPESLSSVRVVESCCADGAFRRGQRTVFSRGHRL